MALIDTHCHLDDDRFDRNRSEIVERARQQGIQQIILPAITASRWAKVKLVAAQYSGIFPAYGLHPMFMGQHLSQHIRDLDEWLDREKPVAVGECGLDFYQSRDDEKWQLEIFTEQLDLARNHQLPVIVHVRKAMDQVIGLLRKTQLCGGVIHSFSGSLQQARQLAEFGFKLGIAATVNFDRAKKLRSVVAEINEEVLLLESDAPDQPGINHRGELNEPAYIVEQLQTMASLRNTSVENLSEVMNNNARLLFRL